MRRIAALLTAAALAAACHHEPALDLGAAVARTEAVPTARFTATFHVGPLVLRARGAYDRAAERASVVLTLPDGVDEATVGRAIEVIAIGPITYARGQLLATLGGGTGWVAVDRSALGGPVERAIDPLAIVEQLAGGETAPRVALDGDGRVRAISDGSVSVRLFDFGKDVAIEQPPTDRETR